jgi:hypothetical protein
VRHREHITMPPEYAGQLHSGKTLNQEVEECAINGLS